MFVCLFVHSFLFCLLRSKQGPRHSLRDKEAKGQMDNGTKGQRDKGKKGQMDKGTKGQRNKGTKGQNEIGTTGQRDRGTKGWELGNLGNFGT